MEETKGVKAWEEQIWLPTYEVGEPDRNPMFLENRVYQGSSGVVFPLPVIDKVFDHHKQQSQQQQHHTTSQTQTQSSQTAHTYLGPIELNASGAPWACQSHQCRFDNTIVVDKIVAICFINRHLYTTT